MKKASKLLLFVSILLGFKSLFCVSAVTYKLTKGRFGDHLVSYAHARWISYKFAIPVLFKPFEYSDQLILHDLHQAHSNKEAFKRKVAFPKHGSMVKIEELGIKSKDNTLYKIPFFAETRIDREREHSFCFDIDWNDQRFIELLRKEICLKKPINLLTIPENHVSLAVHIRVGSGPDRSAIEWRPHEKLYNMANYPLRFPPEHFYVEQIKKIADLFKNKPIYCYIFTDHKQPHELVERIKNAVNMSHIVFDYTKQNNTAENAVLEDFFNLTQFDCLIRPESHFSIMASKLGNYKVIIYPSSVKMQKNNMVIDQVETILKNT